MTKSQFNIKISKSLLTQIKRQAVRSGKTLTEHITDLIVKSLAENDKQELDGHSINMFNALEDRLLTIESKLNNLVYTSPKLKPFNDAEAFNCTKFMKGVFDQEVERRDFININQAFDDLLKHIEVYSQINESFGQRLKEIMIIDNSPPWTGQELNDLVGDDKCNCSIRKGLISWTGKRDYPSQQEICDRGEELVSSV